jgi:hypothetical protein
MTDCAPAVRPPRSLMAASSTLVAYVYLFMQSYAYSHARANSRLFRRAGNKKHSTPEAGAYNHHPQKTNKPSTFTQRQVTNRLAAAGVCEPHGVVTGRSCDSGAPDCVPLTASTGTACTCCAAAFWRATDAILPRVRCAMTDCCASPAGDMTMLVLARMGDVYGASTMAAAGVRSLRTRLSMCMRGASSSQRLWM